MTGNPSPISELVTAPKWLIELADLDMEHCEFVLLVGGGFAVLPSDSPLLARSRNFVKLPFQH